MAIALDQNISIVMLDMKSLSQYFRDNFIRSFQRGNPDANVP